MRTSLVLRPVIATVLSSLAVVSACTDNGTSDPVPSSGGSSSATGGTTGGAQTGGTSTSGGTTTGGVSTGGVSTGGLSTGGASTGGASTGGTSGAATGGISGGAGTGGEATGGAIATGGAGMGGAATGGTSAGGAGTGGVAGSGGRGGTAGAGGSGGMVVNTMGPCDIYAAASPATPCVAAYSTVRALRSAYTGPLYQVRKGGPDPNTGSGGTTQDIGIIAGGFADAAAQDAFCGTSICTVSKLYDQSGRNNHLTVAKAGCYGCDTNPPDTACTNDYESDAKRRPTVVGGRNVYALYMDAHEGYRNSTVPYPQVAAPGSGMPTGQQEQGIYMVAEGSAKRPGAGCCCCWNFGNASTNNCYGPSGQMNALFLGDGYWGSGAGAGPWFMGDFEAGVWAGGTGASNAVNNNSPSMNMNYAFGILKTRPNNYAIRVANAQTGSLTTAYDGGTPTAFPNGQWSMDGGIILGIGGDNSNHSTGTFLEGAITAGRPSDATDAAVLQNVQATRYGQ